MRPRKLLSSDTKDCVVAVGIGWFGCPGSLSPIEDTALVVDDLLDKDILKGSPVTTGSVSIRRPPDCPAPAPEDEGLGDLKVPSRDVNDETY